MRYAIQKPQRQQPFCYIDATSASRALKFARKLFTLPRGTVAYETTMAAGLAKTGLQAAIGCKGIPRQGPEQQNRFSTVEI
jgi:hypothetical protein